MQGYRYDFTANVSIKSCIEFAWKIRKLDEVTSYFYR